MKSYKSEKPRRECGGNIVIKKTLKWLAVIVVVFAVALFAWGYAADIPVAELKTKYANSESEFVDLGQGLTVHLRDEGPADAPAIVLLHGSNSQLQTWDEWTSRLKDTYRIIRLDLPGHGLTGPDPKNDYSTAASVSVIDRLAANRGLTHFTLGGNSMGGGIAYAYAVAHPEKLDGLILVDAGGGPESKSKRLPIGFRVMQMPVINRLATVITPRSMIEKSLRSSVTKAGYIDDAEVDLYWNMLRRPGNRDATVRRFAGYGKRDPNPKPIANSPVPTLILWGAKDKLIPVNAVPWFEKQFPDHVTHIYENTGHLPMQEVAARSASDVAAWMARPMPLQKAQSKP
jgi:pimeloyl-ACP methyl ester carboxylesterase